MNDNDFIIFSSFYNDVYGDPSDDESRSPEVMEYAECVNEEEYYTRKQALSEIPTNDILCIANVGTWHGRVYGHKIIHCDNLAAIFHTNCDQAKWYVNRYKNLCFYGIHHDGSNSYTYRELKDGVDSREFEERLFNATESDNPNSVKNLIARYTQSLGREAQRKCLE